METLNEEMGKNKYDEGDDLFQLANQLKTQSPLVAGEKMDVDEMKEILDDLAELAGVSKSNNINFCLMGGMAPLLEIMVGHESDEVRS